MKGFCSLSVQQALWATRGSACERAPVAAGKASLSARSALARNQRRRGAALFRHLSPWVPTEQMLIPDAVRTTKGLQRLSRDHEREGENSYVLMPSPRQALSTYLACAAVGVPCPLRVLTSHPVYRLKEPCLSARDRRLVAAGKRSFGNKCPGSSPATALRGPLRQ